MTQADDAEPVRGTLHIIGATAWLLIVVEMTVGDGAMVHRGSVGIASFAAGWLLMLLAMMVPLLAEPVSHLRVRTFARRRTRVITLFGCAYLVVWVIAGGVLDVVAGTLALAGPVPALVAVLSAALAWHATPARGRCLNRTRSHPALPAFGLAGDVAAVRYGLTHGVWCVATCWAPMLLPLVVNPAIEPVAMGAAALWLTAERLERPVPPRWRLPVPTAAAHALRRSIHRRGESITDADIAPHDGSLGRRLLHPLSPTGSP